MGVLVERSEWIAEEKSLEFDDGLALGKREKTVSRMTFKGWERKI